MPDNPKFSPGPWVAITHVPGEPHIVRSYVDTNGRRRTEYVMSGCQEADAHLIAAAPDLYAALVEARETIRIFHGAAAWDIYDRCSPEMQRINAALAKAEGRS